MDKTSVKFQKDRTKPEMGGGGGGGGALIKLQHPLISPTDKLILTVSFDKRRETIKKSPYRETIS